MINRSRLIREAKELGADITEQQAETLGRYIEHMVEINKSLNLTAITEPREIEIKHLLDCIAICGLAELRGAVADVGTGAGFPGVVIKSLRPELDVTLIDATAKKLAFIEKTCAEVQLNIKTVHGRAEELARGEYRELFDTVVARAVAPLCSLVEYCMPLVRIGGFFLAMKGPEADEELAESAYAVEQLGGGLTVVENFQLPGQNERCFVKIKKISQTPSKYPRNGKNIAKKPLKKR